MPTSSSQSCDRCQAPLSPQSVAGLCARCLAAELLSPDYIEPLEAGASPAVLRYFGDYEFLEPLSRGGMGAVYRARQVSLNRVVAVKVLVAGGARSAALAKRFRVEAEAAARLQHPHIVPIHEFGEYGGEPFLSMKYIEEARSLVEACLPALEALAQLASVARAVHYAHQHGVLHRDLKPSNILVGRDGLAYLTDFGLAKLASSNAGLTLTQETLGTPAYMAPEQAIGGTRDVTVAADVYGLGAVLYELLAGRPPFVGPTTAAILRQVIEEDPLPPRRAAMEAGHEAGWVDRDLETVCLKALSKEPARRYGSAEAFAEDLSRWLQGETVEARPAGAVERIAKWTRRRPVAAFSLVLAVLAVLAVTVGSLVVSRRLAERAERQRRELVQFSVRTANSMVEQFDALEAARHVVRAIELEAGTPDRDAMQRLRCALTLRELPELERVLDHTGPVNSARFSSDSRRLVTASDDDTARVWDLEGTDVAPRILRHGTNVAYAVFRPGDRERVVTLSEDGLARLWNAATGEPLNAGWPCRVLPYKRSHSPSVAFSPDGTRVLTLLSDRVEFWDVDGSERAAPPLMLRDPQSACFDPTGERVLTTRSFGGVEVWMRDAAGRWVRVALFQHATPHDAAFSPDGRLVLSVASDHTARVWSLETGQAVTPPLRHDAPLRVMQMGFSPDGREAMTLSFDNSARVWEVGPGEAIHRRMVHPKGLSLVVHAPDGRNLLTAGFDGTVRFWDRRTAERSAASLHHRGHVYDLQFSPDGTRLASAGQDGRVRLWSSADRRARWRFRYEAGLVAARVVPPESDRLVLWGVDQRVHFLDLATGRAAGEDWILPSRPVTGAIDDQGRRVATAMVDGTVQVRELASGQEVGPAVRGTAFPRLLEFSPEGGSLVVVRYSPRAGEPGLFTRVDLESHRTEALPVPPDHEIVSVAFSPDGRWMATGGVEGTAVLWDTRTWAPVGDRMNVGGTVYRLVFRPDSRVLVTAMSDRTYDPNAGRLWTVPDGRPHGGALNHRDGVVTVVVSRDGRWIASGGEDGVARVWTASLGLPVGPELGHDNKVTGLSFSPDARLLMVTTVGNSVRLWDAVAGEALTRELPMGSTVLQAQFCRGGREALVVTAAGDIETWDLTPDRRSRAELEQELVRLGLSDSVSRR